MRSSSRLPALVALMVAATAGAAGGGCTAVTTGSGLSSRPALPGAVYLSTGTAPWPFRTLGFIQVTGYGVTAAGVIDAGDASLDGTVRVALVNEAVKLGGHGVIHIEFEDENPPTPAERAMDAAKTMGSIAQNGGHAEIETRKRAVVVTGEVIQFLN